MTSLEPTDGPLTFEELQLATRNRGSRSRRSATTPAGDFAWRGWSYEWDARPGEHELSCRATDAAGSTQPLEQPWNRQGVGNNLVQRVSVSVRPG